MKVLASPHHAWLSAAAAPPRGECPVSVVAQLSVGPTPHWTAGVHFNAAIVDPGFIASVRKKLALDQREAAEIFGGGVNAFSRYENGKTKPPLALVKLLKVLNRHPDLLNEVRAA